jgi:hypothetical protein
MERSTSTVGWLAWLPPLGLQPDQQNSRTLVGLFPAQERILEMSSNSAKHSEAAPKRIRYGIRVVVTIPWPCTPSEACTNLPILYQDRWPCNVMKCDRYDRHGSA